MEIPFGLSIKYFTGPLHDSLSFQMEKKFHYIINDKEKPHPPRRVNFWALPNWRVVTVFLFSRYNSIPIPQDQGTTLDSGWTHISIVFRIWWNKSQHQSHIQYIVNVSLHLLEIFGDLERCEAVEVDLPPAAPPPPTSPPYRQNNNNNKNKYH